MQREILNFLLQYSKCKRNQIKYPSLLFKKIKIKFFFGESLLSILIVVVIEELINTGLDMQCKNTNFFIIEMERRDLNP